MSSAIAALGTLMGTSHRSCRDDHEISAPEVEALVQAAEHAGALGARVTGAGFGGCTVNLVPAAGVEEFLAAIDTAFYRPRLSPASDPAGHRFVFAPEGAATVTPVA
jgi:galactokinase